MRLMCEVLIFPPILNIGNYRISIEKIGKHVILWNVYTALCIYRCAQNFAFRL